MTSRFLTVELALRSPAVTCCKFETYSNTDCEENQMDQRLRSCRLMPFMRKYRMVCSKGSDGSSTLPSEKSAQDKVCATQMVVPTYSNSAVDLKLKLNR